jgi:alanine dehydrogenase
MAIVGAHMLLYTPEADARGGLIGTADGRASAADITLFDSTGLALQDLAVALVAIRSADKLELPQIPL